MKNNPKTAIYSKKTISLSGIPHFCLFPLMATRSIGANVLIVSLDQVSSEKAFFTKQTQC